MDTGGWPPLNMRVSFARTFFAESSSNSIIGLAPIAVTGNVTIKSMTAALSRTTTSSRGRREPLDVSESTEKGVLSRDEVGTDAGDCKFNPLRAAVGGDDDDDNELEDGAMGGPLPSE